MRGKPGGAANSFREKVLLHITAAFQDKTEELDGLTKSMSYLYNNCFWLLSVGKQAILRRRCHCTPDEDPASRLLLVVISREHLEPRYTAIPALIKSTC